MNGLCEDLLLLALAAGNGSLGWTYAISYVLMAAELVQLAASGRVDVTSDRILVADPGPTGDPELDATLAEIAGLASPPRPADWVARPSARVLTAHFERLTAAGVTCPRHRWRFSMRWRITDDARLAQARWPVEAITGSAGPVDTGQVACAVLVCAAGLDRRLYRGRAHRAERQRLREVAGGRWTAGPGWAPGPAATAGTASPAFDSEAARAAAQTAVLAAAHAAVDATTWATRTAIRASAATG